jgi:hypothetical protein
LERQAGFNVEDHGFRLWPAQLEVSPSVTLTDLLTRSFGRVWSLK